MVTDRQELSLKEAAEQNKIAQHLIGYLKIQQAFESDFFVLFMNGKINGRLFYNTCKPGQKEVIYGDDDLLQPEFKTAIEAILNREFKDLTIEETRSGTATPRMRTVIDSILVCIENNDDWLKFWMEEIKLQSYDETHNKWTKKELYNTVIRTAAYKILVSCINQTKIFNDPHVQMNVAKLVQECTRSYTSCVLTSDDEFGFKHPGKRKDESGDFMVFRKRGEEGSADEQPAGKKARKNNPGLSI